MGVATGGWYRSRVGFYETERGGGGKPTEEGGRGPSFHPSLPILFNVSPEPESGGGGGGTATFLETLSAVPAHLHSNRYQQCSAGIKKENLRPLMNLSTKTVHPNLLRCTISNTSH
jgi:hypothetical protein